MYLSLLALCSGSGAIAEAKIQFLTVVGNSLDIALRKRVSEKKPTLPNCDRETSSGFGLASVI
jgi:hypothetical protein